MTHERQWPEPGWSMYLDSKVNDKHRLLQGRRSIAEKLEWIADTLQTASETHPSDSLTKELELALYFVVDIQFFYAELERAGVEPWQSQYLYHGISKKEKLV